MRKLLIALLSASLIAALFLPLTLRRAEAVPIPVMVLSGNVTVNGQSAGAGLTITAEIGGAVLAITSTASDGTYGVATPFNVLGDDLDTTIKEGGEDGETVVVRVEEIQAATTIFSQGTTKQINLAVIDTTAPGAPGNVAKTSADTDNTPTFTWSASVDPSPGLRVSFYEVRVTTVPSLSTFTNIGNITTHTINTIIPNGSHTFQVRAVDKAGKIGTATSLNFTIQTIGVVANFTADATKGAAPLTVNFTSVSTGDINSFAWDFGVQVDTNNDGVADSQTSSLQNPTVTYLTGGDFTVKLTVQGPGGIDDETKANFIRTIKSEFTQDKTSGAVPLAVQFTSQAQGTIISFAWDFNGDNIADSVQQNPSFTYTVGGNFTVSLKVTGPAGSDTRTKANLISTAEVPVAQFTADVTKGAAPLTVKFTNLSTGNPTSFAWDFDNDGVTDSTAQNPTFTYSTGGNFTVKLTVSNIAGSDFETKASFIRTIKADFTVSSTGDSDPGPGIKDIVGETPATVTFTNASTGTVDALFWDFNGDGLTDRVDVGSLPATVNFPYSVSGVFSPHLRASGPAGLSVVIKASLINIRQLPTAEFTADNTSGPAPLTVKFTDQSTGNPSTFAWDFDTATNADGQGTADDDVQSTAQNPTFTYSTGGNFTVKLTVSNDAGSDSETKTNFIQTIKADFTVSSDLDSDPGPGIIDNVGATVTFTNASTGTISILFWDFNGDGFTDRFDIGTIPSSVTFTYNVGGVFSPRLRASGPAGLSDVIKANLITIRQPPTAQFTANVTKGPTPLTVQFTNQSTGSPTSFAWDFGTQVDTDNNGVVDSQTSTLQNPIVTYLTGGNFTVKLIATNIAGSNTITKAGFIQTIKADFTVSSANDSDPGAGVSDNAGAVVTFTNASTGTVNVLFWDFNGDGSIDAVDFSPFGETFTFSLGGVFSPKLFASGSAGISTVTKANLISILAPPVAQFTANVTKGVAPLTVQFTNQSTGNPTSFAWDFDNNGVTDSTAQNPSTTYSSGGDFTVKLTATNAAGSDPEEKTAFIRTIKADFTTDLNIGATPFTVTFTNTSTGSINALFWDFNGDGSVDTVDLPPLSATETFTYGVGGVFSPNLKASGPAGISTVTKANAITVLQPPTADFSTNTRKGGTPLTVTFTNASSGNPTAFLWNFGTQVDTDNDGTVDSQTSTQQNPTVTYLTGGNFTVSLTASNNAGANTKTRTNLISTINASFIATPTSGTASSGNPLSVNFTDTSTGTVETRFWDFNNDGFIDSVQQNPTFPYTSGGKFTVRLVVFGPAGIDQETKLNLIQVFLEPTAEFTANVNQGTAPLTVNFTNLSTGNPTSFAWDFDNSGTTDSTAQNPSFTYTAGGDFTVKLTVSNDAGSDVETKLNFIRTIKADFNANPTSGVAPLTVNFTSSSQGSILLHLWDFNNDGLVDSIAKDPTVTYAQAGTRTVKLTIFGPAGVASITKVNLIQVLSPPVAEFSASGLQGSAPRTISFINLSTGNPTSFAWDFGTQVDTDNNGTADSQTSTQQNPTVTYLDGGDFTVSLTATNSSGTSTKTKTNFVQLVKADFTANVTTGNKPITITFTDQSQGSVLFQFWDLDGDGFIDATGNNPTFVYNTPGQFTIRLYVLGLAGFDVEEKVAFITIQ